MKQPSIQVDLDEHGRIARARGDLRLYQPFAERHNAPTLSTILALKESASILPDGSPALSGKSLDEQPLVWYVDVYGETVVRLTNIGREIQLDFRISQAVDRENPAHDQISVDLGFRDESSPLEDILLAVYEHEDLKLCTTVFEDSEEDSVYVNDTSALVEAARALRKQREEFYAKLTATPLPKEVDEEDES